jgi:hypothetical protein
VEVHAAELDPLDPVHLEKVDRDHPSAAVARSGLCRGDLAPAAGRGAEIDDALTGLEQPVFLVDLEELVGRAGAIALASGLRHVRIVELPLEPEGRGERAFAGGLDSRLQRPSALAARAASGHRT